MSAKPLSQTPEAIRKRRQRAHHEEFDSEEWCDGFWYDGGVVPDMMVFFRMLDSKQRDDRSVVNAAIGEFVRKLAEAWDTARVPGDNIDSWDRLLRSRLVIRSE